MSTRIQLVDFTAFTQYADKPIPVDIGKECSGFFRKVSMTEFLEIRQKLATIDTFNLKLSEEDRKDPVKEEEHTKAYTEFSCGVIAELFVSLITDENGKLAFKPTDAPSIQKRLNATFVSDFIDAFMRAQGVSKEEVASVEAEFPVKA